MNKGKKKNINCSQKEKIATTSEKHIYSNNSAAYSRVKLSDKTNQNNASSNKKTSNWKKNNFSQKSSSNFHYSVDGNQQNIKLINYSKLRMLSEKDSNEILLTILDKRSGFFSLLNENNVNCNCIAYMAIALGKACASDLVANINVLIKNVNSNSDCILIHMQRYLVSLQKQKKLEEVHLDSIRFLTAFLQKFQSILPSLSSEFVGVLIPLVDSTCTKYLNIHEDLHSVSEKLKEVNEQNQFFLQQHSLNEVKKLSEKEKLHLEEPPESFRSLSVLPTEDDINLPCLFLRPNIVEGKYKDTEHYLDVQYRLLREDYIKPLRDGIAQYLNVKKGVKCSKISDVRVYNDVNIIGKDFVNGDLLHLAQFSKKTFSKIDWKCSKRLLTGNLLCFSLNDFQTMLFASVVRRDPKDLHKGLLYIRFEEITDKVLNIIMSTNHVVIETGAYFEAYRHNLKALHELNENLLPLKKYIINVEKLVTKPEYLQETTIYDMRPLLLPLDKKYVQKINRDCIKYKYPYDISPTAEFVNVLDQQCWPTAIEFNLDNSQYTALKSAITKELSIIQGPPGTGKTYIGLRIVQLLLHNISKWFYNKVNSFPILIVCYTNHALDQFLEGLLFFTSKLVRIGGRSASEAISKYQLNNLKMSMREKCPNYISNNIYQKRQEMNQITRKIDKIAQYLNKAVTDTVLSEEVLKKHIPKIQYQTLKTGVKKYKQNPDDIVCKWLGIGSNSVNFIPQNIWKKYDTSDLDTSFEENEEFESDGEVDVEYIENQRNIEFYDFDDCFFQNSLEHNYEDGDFEDSERIQNEIIDYETKQLINKYIKYSLGFFEVMEEATAIQVEQVWNLEVPERWQLYKYWLYEFLKEKQIESLHLQEELKYKLKEIAEMRTEEEWYILQNNHIVGMTTTGAAKYRHLVQRLNPAILIVEEAAEILESHIVTSLAPNTQHVILIGDQQQLRPSPTVHMLAVKYDMDISLFERMIRNGIDYCKLSIQHRMRPEIAALIVPHIYTNLQNHSIVTKFENIKGVNKNVYFVSHSFKESSVNDSKSKVNQHEAKFLIQLCKYLILQGYEPSQITILTTYKGQYFALKNLATGNVKNVHITVVDNFQGEENDIILISFVRSNSDGVIGFLKVPNRVCVALSRAKKGLFCIGNFELLAEKSDLWENIVITLKLTESIGSSLQLTCQNHPGVNCDVSNALDFKNVPNGGCSQKCEYRLNCGHVCILMCHPYDKLHTNIICKKSCTKICERNHQCKKKCFEKCYCEVLVDRKLKRCGHMVNEFCGKNEEKISCKNPCTKSCIKGHPCPRKCCEDCSICKTLIDITLVKCGHTVNEICGKPEEEILCNKPCSKNCEKGHPCPKKCFQDCENCKILIDVTFEKCGHTVKEFCGTPVKEILCKEPCIKSCEKGHLCPKKCYEDCGSCTFLINRKLEQCGHIVKVACGIKDGIRCLQPCVKTCGKGHKCEKKCFEMCGSCKVLIDKKLKSCGHTVKTFCGKKEYEITCNFKCERKLLCSHQCPKLCSEACLQICEQPCLKTCEQGHLCQKECSQKCGSCTFKVDKTLKQCGHTVKAPCGKLEEEILCNFKCKEILPCSHNCMNRCGEPCVKLCKQFKEAQSPICKHSVRVYCYIADNSELLFKKSLEQLSEMCSEKCIDVLPCGHKCIGTCGKCYQGRLHVACGEACERILICGHRCQFKCSKSCPPCQYPCENKCIHAKCTKRCSEPCLKCRKSCAWACSHKKCTHSCNEICNREPCDQPCPKILSCSHPCIGFCGEPCPLQCRICDNKECTFFSELKDDRYVLLDDCNHVFEIRRLNDWMALNLKCNKSIAMKTCPSCNTIIRKNFRYNHIVKTSLLQLEKVKHVFKENRERNRELQNILLHKSITLTSLYGFNASRNTLLNFLSSNIIKNNQELITIENIITIATGLNASDINPNLFKHSLRFDALRKLIQYMLITKMKLGDFTFNYFRTMSEHQLFQLSFEFQRLKLIGKLLKCSNLEIIQSYLTEFENCVQCLLNYRPFNNESEKQFSISFDLLACKIGVNDTDLTTPIELPLLKAMNMSSEHWYECLQGHVYCVIGYMGSTMVNCYECNKKPEDKHLYGHFRLANIDSTRNWQRIRNINGPTGSEYQAVGQGPSMFEIQHFCKNIQKPPATSSNMERTKRYRHGGNSTFSQYQPEFRGRSFPSGDNIRKMSNVIPPNDGWIRNSLHQENSACSNNRRIFQESRWPSKGKSDYQKTLPYPNKPPNTRKTIREYYFDNSYSQENSAHFRLSGLRCKNTAMTRKPGTAVLQTNLQRRQNSLDMQEKPKYQNCEISSLLQNCDGPLTSRPYSVNGSSHIPPRSLNTRDGTTNHTEHSVNWKIGDTNKNVEKSTKHQNKAIKSSRKKPNNEN